MFVTEFVTKAGRLDLKTVACLCASELVTNAIRHTDSENCALGARLDREAIVLEVTDASPARPSIRRELTASGHGMGLQIIDALTSDWGVRNGDPEGKTVWLRLD